MPCDLDELLEEGDDVARRLGVAVLDRFPEVAPVEIGRRNGNANIANSANAPGRR